MPIFHSFYTRMLIVTSPPCRSPALSVSYSPDASLIAVGLAGGGVSVLKPSEEDITTLQLEKQLDAFQGAGAAGATCVRFSPSGATLSAGGGDGGVKAWGTAEADWEVTGSVDSLVRSGRPAGLVLLFDVERLQGGEQLRFALNYTFRGKGATAGSERK